MGRALRVRPARLAEKLRQVRLTLGLSQSEMLRRLAVEELIDYTKISGYETGERVPPLPILLRYGEVAGVWVDVLINDELDLPDKLPSAKKHEGVRRRAR
jgi:transcriptional regulator with XRE-family HTH domain